MRKRNAFVTIIIVIVSTSVISAALSFRHKMQQVGYIFEHEEEVASSQSGPHDGGGSTTAYNYFSKATDCKLVFRKRRLHPGSSIGYHLQTDNEIYYIVSGNGEMKMNGKTFAVKAGDGILTLPGSSHSLTPTGTEDLVVIINYEKK